LAEFKGPLGIWGFPLINLILKMFGEKRASVRPMHNVEEWEWIDSTGNARKLTVHRKVE